MQIKTLTLETSFLETLKEFYSSKLELPVESATDQLIVVRIGRSNLVFTETTEGEPFYHFAIDIPANKIEEAKEWLGEKVNLLNMEDHQGEIANFTNWNAKSIYFYDPAGNIVELIARMDLDNEKSEPFSAAQFLCISEAGLVFDDSVFNDQVDYLLQKYELANYAKQPPMDHFRAIGDENGLFVVVPENRNWYPTDKPAGNFPMSIEFENEGSEWSLEL
jgi:catechol 2,3-dioxygenase-like lactoylglutathione lyase family enzyme